MVAGGSGLIGSERMIHRAYIVGLFLVISSLFSAPPRPLGIPLLTYHEIAVDGREPGETVIQLDRFREQMKWLHDHSYGTLSLSEFANVLAGNALIPSKAVVLIFDDGWKSQLLAVPILEEYGFKATFMVIAGPKGIGDPYLSWNDIVELDQHPLFKVESHTFSHPWDHEDNLVTWIDGRNPGRGPEAAFFELSESKRVLENHLKRPITVLAWPCGWYNDSLIALAKQAGYTLLLSTEDGFNEPGRSSDRIRRTMIDGACPMTAFEQTLQDGRYRVCQTTSPPTSGHLP